MGEMLVSLKTSIQNTETALVMNANNTDSEVQQLQNHLKNQVEELERGIRVFADMVQHEEASLLRAEEVVLALEVQYSHLNYVASQKPVKPLQPVQNQPIQIRRVMERPGDRPIHLLHTLTMDEYDMIPKYLLGRTTLDRLVAFVRKDWLIDRINDSIQEFNKIIIEKYTIMKQSTKSLIKQDKDRIAEWKTQDTKDTHGKVFITEGDVKNNNSKSVFRMDPHGRSVLSFLRHLGHIKEVRGGGHLRFVLQ